MTDIIEIANDKFFDNQLLSVVLSVNVFPTESMFKYQQIISLILCKILVVLINIMSNIYLKY